MHKKTIVLDAGHGGHDPGAVGNRLKEKDRALTYTLKLGKELERLGFKVIYTRTTDKFIELTDRSRISNNANATICISIHLNSFTDANSNGLETLYYPTSTKGKKLATDVQRAIVSAGLCNSDRGIKPRGNLSVLKGTNAPAILIELGFISNAKDVQLLADKEDEIVQAIARGVTKSLGVKYIEGEKSMTNKPSSWAKNWDKATKEGVVDGTRPKEAVTREEVVEMIYRKHK